MIASRLWMVVLGIGCMMTVGCGPTGVKVGGSVVSKGATYSVPEGDEIQVMISDDKSGSFSGTVGSDGKFTIKEGEPIPAGTYKVQVMVYKVSTKKPTGPPTPKDYPDSWNVETTPNFTLDMAKLK